MANLGLINLISKSEIVKFSLYYVQAFFCCPKSGPHAANQSQIATLGVTGASSVVEIRSDEYDEVWQCTRPTRFHSDRQRRDAELFRENPRKIWVYVPELGKIIDVKEGCIILRVMLTTAQSLNYYKDPEQKKALGEKLKDVLKTLRKENNMDFSDVDGIKIHISEEDIQKAEMFFNIGKYVR